jgi:2-aminoadipate transaminase
MLTKRASRDSQAGYLTIAEDFRSKILGGELPSGSRLPSVRDVAKQYRVALTTAQRAYKALTELGLIEGRRGAGTHVAAQFGRGESINVLSNLKNKGLILSYEKISDQIGLRSFATGVPDPVLFRSTDFIAEFEELRRESPWSWYYSPGEGVPALRSEIGAMIRRRGLKVHEEDVLVTHGSTHALTVILDELQVPSGKVILQQPGFVGSADLIKALRLEAIGVPINQDGIDLERFEKTARKHPGSAVILFPTFHPATGRSILRACEILHIAERHRITVIEVDQYRDIDFEEAPPPLASLDETVIYVDSFAYSVIAGIRLGYIATQRPLLQKLTWRLTATTMTPSAPLQRALAGYMSGGFYKAHLCRVVPEYKRRRDALLQALDVHFPSTCYWTRPQGGFASWVELPVGDWDDLYEEAVQRGVAFTPSDLLMLEKDSSKLRLAYGCQKPEAIEAGVESLSRLIRARLRR